MNHCSSATINYGHCTDAEVLKPPEDMTNPSSSQESILVVVVDTNLKTFWELARLHPKMRKIKS